MAKAKITQDSIFSAYSDFVLEHGEEPKSVYLFAKANKMTEAEFYKFFSGFESIEKMSFSYLYHNTVNTIEASKNYKELAPRAKLLTFYYTFFENLTANRSYIKYILEKNNSSLKNLKSLKDFRTLFQKYVTDLGIEKFDLNMKEAERISKVQDRALEESAWVQFLLTYKTNT